MKTFLLIFLLLASTGASAALRKWVDANGQAHYSDQPPPADVEAKTLRSASDTEEAQDSESSNETEPAAQKSIAEREAEITKSRLEKKKADDKAAQEKSNAEAMKTGCTASQENLDMLQEGIRMFETDANGERTPMDENRRQQLILKNKEDLKRFCK